VYFDLQDHATRPLGEVLADLARTMASRASMKKLPEIGSDNQGQYFREQFLPGFLEIIGTDRRPVILLDEFDALDQSDKSRLLSDAAAISLFRFIRQVMAEQPTLAFVFVVGRQADDLPVNISAAFKATSVHELWVLDDPSARELVLQAEANGTLRISGSAVERILSLTNKHPYLTQLLCQRIWQRAYTRSPAEPPDLIFAQIRLPIIRV
jgi:hypothetical protein